MNYCDIKAYLLEKSQGAVTQKNNHSFSIVKTIYNFSISLPFDDISIVANDLITFGFWEYYNVLLFNKLLKDGDKVVEVGANFGEHSVILANLLAPKGYLYSFEPNKVGYSYAKKNLESLAPYNSYALYKIALSDIERKDNILLNKKSAVSWSTLLDNKEVQQDDLIDYDLFDVEIIESVKFDNFIGKQNDIKLFKVDAEGHECSVIRGAKNTLTQSKDVKLMLEWGGFKLMPHEDFAYKVSCFNDMRKMGFYYFYSITKDSETPELLYSNKQVNSSDQCIESSEVDFHFLLTPMSVFQLSTKTINWSGKDILIAKQKLYNHDSDFVHDDDLTFKKCINPDGIKNNWVNTFSIDTFFINNFIRTKEETDMMSLDDKKNTIITEFCKLVNNQEGCLHYLKGLDLGMIVEMYSNLFLIQNEDTMSVPSGNDNASNSNLDL